MPFIRQWYWNYTYNTLLFIVKPKILMIQKAEIFGFFWALRRIADKFVKKLRILNFHYYYVFNIKKNNQLHCLSGGNNHNKTFDFIECPCQTASVSSYSLHPTLFVLLKRVSYNLSVTSSFNKTCLIRYLKLITKNMISFPLEGSG